eukprot:g35587.t1
MDRPHKRQKQDHEQSSEVEEEEKKKKKKKKKKKEKEEKEKEEDVDVDEFVCKCASCCMKLEKNKCNVGGDRGVMALSPDAWRLVCSFVADNPLWLFKTWSRVCKRASSPSARPAAPPFALDLSKIRGKYYGIPAAVCQGWKELTCVTLHGAAADTRQKVLASLASSNTQVHAISLADMSDLDFAGAARIKGLASIVSGCWAGLPVHLDLTDAGLVHLAGLRTLRHLDLAGCRFLTDAGLKHLADLDQLQRLSLRGCRRLSDAGLKHLAGLHQLEHLDLRDCDGLTYHGLRRFVAGMHQLNISTSYLFQLPFY